MFLDQFTVGAIMFIIFVVTIVLLLLFVIYEVIKYIVIDEIAKMIKARVIEGLYLLVKDYNLDEVDDDVVQNIAELIVEKHYKNSFDYKTGKPGKDM
jgi:uncharacterized membrane protein